MSRSSRGRTWCWWWWTIGAQTQFGSRWFPPKSTQIDANVNALWTFIDRIIVRFCTSLSDEHNWRLVVRCYCCMFAYFDCICDKNSRKPFSHFVCESIYSSILLPAVYFTVGDVGTGHCLANDCLLGFNELIAGAQNKTIFSIKLIQFFVCNNLRSVCAGDCVPLNILRLCEADHCDSLFKIRMLVEFFSVLATWY